MEYVVKVAKDEINSIIPSNSALICFASFEKRSTSLATSIDPNKLKMSFVFRNVEAPMYNYNLENYKTICDKLQCEAVEIQIDNPVGIADEMFRVIQKIISSEVKNLIVDISTFTHETLLMLLKTVYKYNEAFSRILLIYNGASSYSAWLSKGCKTIRNIIGYPGRFNPLYKSHMIILTGFEKERATQLVELFEPDVLSIGNGSEPTDENHRATMEGMKQEFSEWFGNLGILWTSFEFSCSNIEKTIDDIKKEINNPEENIVLVPLNTKLSTISAALVALKDERIQLVYPIPEIYNRDYSVPSESFTILDFKGLLLVN